MRKIKEVLRLHFDLKLGQRQIGRSANISQSTVHEYLARFEESGFQWPLPAELSEAELDARLFPSTATASGAPFTTRPLPDFSKVQDELRSRKETTLQLLWEEYRGDSADAFSYSRFCHHYGEWLGGQDLVMRQDHKAGEKLFVDWAGSTMPIHNPKNGEVDAASVFVAVMGASSYLYAEATASQAMEDWIGAHVRAFAFLGAVPELLVPDNLRTGVNKACRYDPELNPTYQELAMHYGVGVIPARVRKARDKAKVEVGVQVAQRWIVAALRRRKFFSLGELNRAIAELLPALNRRPFKKRPGSRRELFAGLDLPAMRPLPSAPFVSAVWSKAVVNIDYHAAVDHSFYSVPYRLTRKTVEVRATANTVEIFHKGERVASHARALQPNTPVTVHEHRPKSHQEHLAWPPSRLVQWGSTVGPLTSQLVDRLMAERPHPEMGYRACLGILRLSGKYGPERMEKAAGRALLMSVCTYKSVKSILVNGLDTLPVLGPATPPAAGAATPPDSNPRTSDHGNIRGSEYFE